MGGREGGREGGGKEIRRKSGQWEREKMWNTAENHTKNKTATLIA